jgi:formylglycine-generating enzyme required for sulfatase activity
LSKVTWTAAQEYADWLSETTGRKFRLLTADEWGQVASASRNGAPVAGGVEFTGGGMEWTGTCHGAASATGCTDHVVLTIDRTSGKTLSDWFPVDAKGSDLGFRVATEN